jgi:hypothetical protein
MSRLWATKLSSTLVFISFLGNKDKISKSALEDNVFWFQIDCTAGISGAISHPLSELAFHMSKSKVSSRPATLVVKLLPLKAV